MLTFDKDFGELVFRMKLAPAPGVILFRMPPVSPSFVAETAVAALAGRSDWAGHFSVVEPGRVRMVELPG